MGLFVYWSAFEKKERQVANPVKPAFLVEEFRKQNREKRLAGGIKKRYFRPNSAMHTRSLESPEPASCEVSDIKNGLENFQALVFGGAATIKP
jgi:hypothetical protein